MTGVAHPVFGTQVPDNWDTARVDEIKSPEPSSCVAGPFGSNISSKYFVDDGVPVIRGGNLSDDLTPFVSDGFVFVSAERARSYKPQHVRAGDLVFTCWGTIGQVGRIPENGPYPEYIISNKQLKLRPDPRRIAPRFLYYYFANPQMVEYIRGRAIGSAVPGINLGILKTCRWCCHRSAHSARSQPSCRRMTISSRTTPGGSRSWRRWRSGSTGSGSSIFGIEGIKTFGRRSQSWVRSLRSGA